ncbi:exoribonuclease II domain protein, partial [Mycoplasmopsis fermentans MF-I1]
HLNRALDGDFVEITVLKYFHSLDDKTFAIVEKVLSRNSDKFIGILGMHEGFLSFKPLKNDYKKINFHIKELVKEARLHDVVLGQMVSFKNNIIELNIIKKIANSNDPMAYVKVLNSY